MHELGAFPDAATLRIFHAARPLTPAECAQIRAALAAFTAQWLSHDMRVVGGSALIHDRFVVIAADESKTHLSGCSKDGLVRAVRAIEELVGTAFVDAPPIVWRDGAEIRCAERDFFAELAAAGKVGPGTIVFDNTISTLGDLRHGRWERPACEAWHARAFDFVEP